MRFLFLGKGYEEASTRYRVRPVADCLTRRGHEVTFRSTDSGLLSRLQLLIFASQFDLVFVQRKLFPVWFVTVLRRRVRRLVFDFDDAIFVKSSGAPSKSRQKKFHAICQASDLVVAGNQYLSALAQPWARLVEVVPTAVRSANYSTNIAKHSQPTLVWIGSSSTRRYLDLLTPVLDQLANRHPDLQLKVIADFDLSLESMPVKNVRWTQMGEAEELAASTIGIAPMVNNAWTRGKCALKVIQYMAAGLPVISDRCGANQEVIVEGETGFLADNEQDWVDGVSRLLADAELRKTMGEAGRLRAETDYQLDSLAEQLGQRLEFLVKSEKENETEA